MQLASSDKNTVQGKRVPSLWNRIRAHDRHVVKYAIERALERGNIVVLTGISGVGKTFLAKEIVSSSSELPDLNGKTLAPKHIPIVQGAKIVIDEAQFMRDVKGWSSFAEKAKAKSMQVLLIIQSEQDLPGELAYSGNVVVVEITKKLYQ